MKMDDPFAKIANEILRKNSKEVKVSAVQDIQEYTSEFRALTFLNSVEPVTRYFEADAQRNNFKFEKIDERPKEEIYGFVIQIGRSQFKAIYKFFRASLIIEVWLHPDTIEQKKEESDFSMGVTIDKFALYGRTCELIDALQKKHL